jgi:hypothetical protein
VEGSRPAQSLLDGLADTAKGFVERFLGDVLRSAAHLCGRTARECQHQDAGGVDTVNDQVRHAVRKRIRLASAGAGYDQKRTRLEAFLGERLSIGHGLALWSVQSVQV